MDIREAKYLLEVEKTQQLTKAAENLFLTQPALSRVLKKLETEFGTPLFIRDGSYFRPTPAGKIVLRHSEEILREYRSMEKELASLDFHSKNIIRIAIPPIGGYLFNDMISAFISTYPDIELKVNSLVGNAALAKLDEGEMDIIFPIRPTNSGMLNEHLLFRSEIGIGVSADHSWAKKEAVPDADFAEQPIISGNESWQFNTQLRERLKKEGIQPVFKMMGNDILWLIDYAKHCDCPVVLPMPALVAYGWEGMKIIKMSPPFKWEMCMAYSKSVRVTPVMRSFINFVLNFYGDPDFNMIFHSGDREIDLSKVLTIM